MRLVEKLSQNKAFPFSESGCHGNRKLRFLGDWLRVAQGKM